MSSPKFKVGEEVILQSHERPDLNGEYFVEEIFMPGNSYTCRYTNNVFMCPSNAPVCYRLEGLTPCVEGMEALIGENLLRKKHQKGICLSRT